MTLEAGEFIRRFLLHTLPDGFHRIRHYGFLANNQPAARLAVCRLMLADQVPETKLRREPVVKVATTPRPCPCCGQPMVTITVWYHGQVPPGGPFWNDNS